MKKKNSAAEVKVTKAYVLSSLDSTKLKGKKKREHSIFWGGFDHAVRLLLGEKTTDKIVKQVCAILTDMEAEARLEHKKGK